MTKTPEEFDVHRAIVYWLLGKNNLPRMLAPDVELWHTPNGGQRRDAFEGKRLKEMGVVAGIHDLFFLRPTDFGPYGRWGLLFGMEVKKPGGRLSPAQLEMHPRLMRAGMAASCVVDNLADAKEFCRINLLTVNKT